MSVSIVSGVVEPWLRISDRPAGHPAAMEVEIAQNGPPPNLRLNSLILTGRSVFQSHQRRWGSVRFPGSFLRSNAPATNFIGSFPDVATP